jgi:hypothetical protein
MGWAWGGVLIGVVIAAEVAVAAPGRECEPALVSLCEL